MPYFGIGERMLKLREAVARKQSQRISRKGCKPDQVCANDHNLNLHRPSVGFHCAWTNDRY